ncbi:class-II fumarase/aspartase family protein [Saccharothrix deserti]|uniref:class-II fumarase/aspartase family protein n=1 Tax=Saccharothrix deserti TaxID=2593674 RepID=UPI00131D06F5|nr:adenylosuccinate lyase family protein [Saccharothrix deserti]
MTFPDTDTGLLSPVWAGTGADREVGDRAWVQAMLDVEVALARAQARLGIIPAEAATAIAEAARADCFDIAALAVAAREAANPVVALVGLLTAAVAARAPSAAEYVHRGGTSQDILDSAAMVLTARMADRVLADLRRAAAAAETLAEEHRDTPMAGRTLTQHAVPTTFGLKAAGWLTLLVDSVARVRVLTETGLPAQLGGAAGTLSAYTEYAGRDPGRAMAVLPVFAAQLGLVEPAVPWHSLRTPLADIAAVSSFVTGALGKIAVDVQVMSRTEVGEVAEPAADGRGASSAMPQKRNPVLSTLLVSAARQVPTHALALTQALVSEDERAAGAWHAEWQPLRECLRLTAGAAHTAAELVRGLEVFPARMRANLDLTGGAIVAERLNAVLAPQLGKATAKRVLARISLAAAAGKGRFEVLLREAPELADLPVNAAALLDPAEYLGAARLLVDRALDRYRKQS